MVITHTTESYQWPEPCTYPLTWPQQNLHMLVFVTTDFMQSRILWSEAFRARKLRTNLAQLLVDLGRPNIWFISLVISFKMFDSAYKGAKLFYFKIKAVLWVANIKKLRTEREFRQYKTVLFCCSYFLKKLIAIYRTTPNVPILGVVQIGPKTKNMLRSSFRRMLPSYSWKRTLIHLPIFGTLPVVVHGTERPSRGGI